MAQNVITSAERTAAVPAVHQGAVTLINSFVVAPGREEAFSKLWRQTSEFFRSQPGFVALRLHRALTDAASYRYVNVATWSSVDQFQAAHRLDEFHRLVSQPEWYEFPSSPALYEVVQVHEAAAA